MSMLTHWGYTLTELDALPVALSESDFDTISGGKYSGDTRIESAIAAATMAVRNYCNWHIYPSAECSVEYTFLSPEVSTIGCDVILQLPSTYVSAVSSVYIDDDEVTSFTISPNGLLRLFDITLISYDRYSKITATYTSGLPDGMGAAITSIIAQKVIHGLSSSYGVSSESAGGVTITYGGSWANLSATSLTDYDEQLLMPYKVKGVY